MVCVVCQPTPAGVVPAWWIILRPGPPVGQNLAEFIIIS